MSQRFKPKNENELKTIITHALNEKITLNVTAGNSKKTIGHTPSAQNILDLEHINGVIKYEPEEMILSVKPATPLKDVIHILKSKKQHLAFEPPHFKHITQTNHEPTIGGAVAAGIAGSKRPYAGGIRDHFLGFNAISGRGEQFKAGGYVIKNVTGYDVPKILAASWGTLAVMTQITLKTMPIPENTKTIALTCNDETTALTAMIAAMKLPCDVTGAAHIPHHSAQHSSIHALKQNAQNQADTTLIRVEGVDTHIQAQFIANNLSNLIPQPPHIIEKDESHTLWNDIGEGGYLPVSSDNAIWRLAVVPAESVAIAQKLRNIGAENITYDWGGGLIWCVLNPTKTSLNGDAKTQHIYDILNQHGGGSAILMRAPEDIRHNTYTPLNQALYTLTHRLKNAFDPNGILNPGRMNIKPYPPKHHAHQ